MGSTIRSVRWFASRIGSTFFVGVVSFAFTTSVFANPVLDNVAHGNVSVQQTATTTTVNQATQKGIINWKSFNINQGEHTHFNQPNGGVTLNRISPNQGASQIFGQLSATGKIILVNPAGVFIGPSAFVNVGGLIASTAGITNENFLNGYYNFDQLSPHANAIVNQGTIIAADHGLVALMGHAVSNEGHIQANLGKVVLASGDAFTMAFAGNELISFVVDQEVMQQGVDAFGNSLADGVKNTGTITANGGQVLVHAKAASNVLDHAINMDGIVQANSVQQLNGEIILQADNNIEGIVRVGGTLDVSGMNAGETGGNISVLGYNLLIDDGAELNASGDAGGGNVRVGGNYLGLGPLPNANALYMAPNSSIYADAITNGDGGEIILWSDHATYSAGTLTSKGGSESGDGGFIETSSKNILNVDHITVDTHAPQGTSGLWLLDPDEILINSGTTNANSGTGFFQSFFGFDTTTLNYITLQNALASNNIEVRTTNNFGFASGNIYVQHSILWSAATTLTLNAQNHTIYLQAIDNTIGTTSTSGGGVTFNSAVVMQATDSSVVLRGRVVSNVGITGTGNTIEFTRNHSNGDSYIYGTNTANQWIFSESGSAFTRVVGTIDTLNGVTINSGVPLFNSSERIADNDTLTMNGGTLYLLGTTETVATYNLNGGYLFNNANINNKLAATTFNVSAGTADAVLSGSGSLIKNGTGTVSLLENNTYTGTTTINNGRLEINDAGAIDNTHVYVNGGTLDINNHTMNLIEMDQNGGTVTGTGLITTNNWYDIQAGTAAAPIGGTNTKLYKYGSGTATISGNNSYSGITYVLDGELLFSSNNNLGNTASISLSGGTLRNTASLTLNKNITYSSGTIFNNSGTTLTISGLISGSGTLTKTGTGNTYLSNSGNTYSGGTTINGGGSLIVAADGALGQSLTTISFSGGNSTPTLRIDTGFVTGRNIVLGLTGQRIEVDAGEIFETNGIMSGSNKLTKTGSGTLRFNNSNSNTGGIDISAGTIMATNNNSLGTGGTFTFTGNNTVLTFSADTSISRPLAFSANGIIDINGTNSTISGTTSGNGTLTVTNSGASGKSLNVTSSTSSRNGTTYINNEAALLSNNGDLGNGAVIVNDGGTLWLDNGVILGNNITINGSGVTTALRPGKTNGALFVESSFANTASGTITLGSASTISVDAVGTTTINNINTNTHALTFKSDTTTNLTGVLSGSGSFTKTGSGTVTLSGDNSSYSGLINISAGTLAAANNNSLGSTSGSVDVYGTLELNNVTIGTEQIDLYGGSTLRAVGTSSYAGHTILRIGSGSNIAIDSGSDTLTMSGQLQSANNGITINKSGSGTLALSSNLNNTTAVIQINAGTLEAQHANALGSSGHETVINSGGTLHLNNITTSELLTLNGGTILASGSTGINNAISLTNTSTLDTGTGQLSLSGNVSGSFTLVKDGAGTLTLNNDLNISTGNFISTEGDIVINNNFTAADLVIPSGGSVTINGGTTTLDDVDNAGDFIISGAVMTADNIINDPNTNFEYNAGAIALTGDLFLDTNSSADISDAISATEITVGDGAVLLLKNSNLIDDNTIIDLNGANSIFALDGYSETVAKVVDGNYTGSRIDFVGGNLTVASNDSDTFYGEFRDSGSFNKQGIGTLTLTADNSTLFTGSLNVQNGTLSITNSNTFGTTGGNTTVASGATLELGSMTTSEPFSLSGGTVSSSAGAITLNGAIDLAASSNFDVDTTVTINSTISGSGNLTKAGTGTLSLSGSNSYTGSTIVNAGTLQINSASGLGSTMTHTSDIAVNGGNLDLAFAGTIDADPTITLDGGNLIKTGASNTTFTGSIILDQASTIRNDGAGTYILNGALNIASHLLTVEGDAGQINLAGNTSGTGGLTKNGTHLLQYGCSSCTGYTGTTIINGGVLRYNWHNRLSDTDAVVINSPGTLVMNGFSDTIGSLSGSGSLTTGPGTVTINQTSNTTFSGSMSSWTHLRVNKTGSGTLTLSGTASHGTGNSGTGTLRIYEGSLALTNSALFDNFDVLEVIPNASATATLNLASLSSFDYAAPITLDSSNSGSNAYLITSAAITLANDITLTGSSNLIFLAINPTELSGAISGTGSLSMDGGTLTLSGSNTFDGDVTLTNGTVLITNANALGTGAKTLYLNGHTLQTENAFTLGSDISIDSGTNGTLNISNSDVTIAGNISGTSLRKHGGGTLRLTGNNTFGDLTINSFSANTHILNDNAFGSGTTTVNNESSLILNFNGSLTNSNQITLHGDGAGGSSGALQMLDDLSLSNPIALGSNTAISVASGKTGTLSGTISGSGNLTKVNTGTLVFTNAADNTYTGTTTINGGILSISKDTHLGTAPGSSVDDSITITDGELLFTSGFNLDNNRGLTIEPADSAAGAATFNISTGTVGWNGKITSDTDDVFTVKGAGTLRYDRFYNGNNTDSLQGKWLVDGAYLNIRSSNRLGGTDVTTDKVTLQNGGTINVWSGNHLPITRGFVLGTGGGTLSITSSESNIIYGPISGAGQLNIQTGANTTIHLWHGGNSLSGGIVVNNDSGFGIHSDSRLASNTVTFNEGSRFVVSNSDTVDNNLILSGNTTFNFGSNAVTLSGIISGSGSLTKDGAGTTRLSGSNTYTGTTTISDGILELLNNTDVLSASNTNPLIIANGATLLFNSTFDGTLAYEGEIQVEGVGDGAIGAIAYGGGSNREARLNNPITLTGNTIFSMPFAGSGNFGLHFDNTITDGANAYNITIVDTNGSGIFLNAANTFSGNVNINAGTLRVAHADALSDNNATTLTVNVGTNLNVDLPGSGAQALSYTGDINLGGQISVYDTNITLANNITLTDNAAEIYTHFASTNGYLTGEVGGNFSLTKSGAGTLTLPTTNTFSGGSTISNGELIIDNNNAALGTGTINIGSGGTLTLLGNALNISNNISIGDGGTINESNLSGMNQISGDITLTNSGSAVFNVHHATSQDILMLTGTLSGTDVTINKTGNGTLNITNDNSATLLNSATSSNFDVQAGTLAVSSNNALGNATADFASGSTLSLLGSSLNVGNDLTLNGATINENNMAGNNTLSGAMTLTGSNTVSSSFSTSDTLTISGNISGTGSLTKGGIGVVVLSGSNTYTGATVIDANSGILRLLSANALGSGVTQSSSTTVNAGSTLDIAFASASTTLGNTNTITLNGTGSTAGALTISATDATLSNAIALGSATTVDTSGSGTLSGQLSGLFDLSKTGTGTLTLSGDNSGYTNAINVNAGTLVVGSNNALGTADADTVVAAAATLSFNNAALATENITLDGGTINSTGTSSLGGTLTLDANSTVNVSSGNLTLNGAITDTTNTFGYTKLGAGTLTLNAVNTYDGATNIEGGTLELTHANALDTTSNVSVINNATLLINNVNVNFATGITLGGSSTAGNLIGTGTATWNGNITLGDDTTIATNSASDSFTINGNINGGFNLSFNGPATGAITVNGDIGNLAPVASVMQFSNISPLTFSGTAVTSTGTQTYQSEVVLADNVTFTTTNNAIDFAAINRDASARNLTINTGSGAINLNGNVGSGSAVGAVSLNSTSTTNILGSMNAASLTIASTSGTTHINNDITTSGNQSYGPNNIILGANTVLTTSDINTTNLTNGGFSLTINNTGTSSSIGGVLLGSGALIKSGSGTLTLAGDNDAFSGGTTINDGKVIITAADSNTVNNIGNGTITLSGGTLQVNDTLTLSNAIDLDTGGGTIETDAGTVLTITGAISGTNSLTFNGTGSGIIIDTAIGETNAITTFDSHLATTLNANVSSTDNQVYHSNVLLGDNVTLNAGNGDITFSGTLNSVSTTPFAITLNSNGVTTFTDTVGATNELSTITTDTGTGGSTAINTASINTTGNMSFNDVVTLGNVTTTLDSSNGNVSFGNTLDGSSALTINSGAGSVVFSGAVGSGTELTSLTSSGSGAVTIDGGSILTVNSQSYTGAITLGDDTTLTSNSANIVLSSTVNGSHALTLDGNTGVTLGGNISTASLDVTGTTSINASNITTPGSQNYNSATTLNTTTTFSSNAASSITGVLSGTGSFIKAGTGTFTLANASNSYSGTTTISNGVLSISSDGNLGSAPTEAVRLILNGGTLQSSSGTYSLSANRNISLNTNSTINVAAGILTIPGTIDDAASSFSLDKTGGGDLILSGNNTFDGGVNVYNAGALYINHNNSLGTGTLILNNGTFGTTAADLTIGNDIDLAGTVMLDASNNFTLSGTVSGSSDFNKSGTGTITLTSANSYAGDTNINAGSIISGIDNALPTTTALSVTGIFDLNNFNQQVASLTGSGTVTNSINNTRGFTVGDATNTTYTGVLTGDLSLTKVGAGSLTLSGTNTYSSVTNVNAGTLTLGANNVISDSSALTVAGGTFDLGGFSDTVAAVTMTSGSIINGTLTGTSFAVESGTISATLAGTGGLTKSNAGTVTLSGANTYTGTTTVSAGTLALGAADRISNSSALTVAGGTFDLGGFSDTVAAVTMTSGSITNGTLTGLSFAVESGAISAALAGTGGLTKSNTGTVTLSGTNTYTGTTTVSAGTLALGAADRISNSSALTVSGGTLDLGGFSDTVDAVTMTSGSITNGTLTGLSFAVESGTISAALAGTGGLTKSNTGTVTLSGANTYTGTTTVSAGTLALGAADRISNSSDLTVSGGTVDLGGFSDTVGAVTMTSGNINNGTLTGVSFAVESGTISAALAGSGANFSKTTAGTVTLSGTNTYTGTTTVSAGTLTLGSANSISDSSALTVASGATFNMGTFAETVGSIAGAGDITNNNTLLTVGGDGSSTAFSGTIAGSGGFTKAGAGTLTLSGANTYTGTTTVSAGTLALGAADRISNSSTLTVAGGTVDLGGFSDTVGAVTMTSGSISNGTLTGTSFAVESGTISAVLAGTGGLTKSNTGTVTLSGANTYTGTTTVSTGTLALGAANRISDSSALTVSGGTLDLGGFSDTVDAVTMTSGSITNGTLTGLSFAVESGTISAALAGTGGLTKSNTGTVTLSGANTYTGTTTVSAGTLALGAADRISNSSDLTVSGGTVDLGGFSDTVGAVTMTSGNINNGTLTGTSFAVESGTISAALAGSGGLTKSNTGTVTLSGANTYTGTTTVSAGTLTLGSANSISDSSALTVASGATFNMGTFAETVGSIAGAGDITNNNTLLTVGGDGSSTAFSGTIAGSGGFTKAGAGTLTLSGANTYTGATAVNEGILKLTHTDSLHSNTAITVASGSSLEIDLASGTALTNTNNITISGTGVGNNGALILSSASLALSNNIVLSAASRIGGAGTLSGVLSGAADLTKVGAGILTLSGDNSSYNNAINVTEGTLSASHANALGSTTGSTIVSDGATLHINGLTVAENISVTGTGVSSNGALTTSGSVITSGTITLAGNATINNAGSLTVNGAIVETGGARALTKDGSGVLAFNTAGNSYTGATTINSGTLQVTNLSGLSSSSAVNVNSGGALDLTADGTLNFSGTLNIAGTGVSNTGALLLSGDTTLTNNIAISATETDTYIGVASTKTGTINGVISGGANGTTTFTKVGTGTLILNGTNTFSGDTSVASGTASLTNTAALGSTAAISVANGASLDINFTSEGQTLANTATITLDGDGVGGNGALIFTRNNSTLNNDVYIAPADTATIALTAATGALNGDISEGTMLLKLGTNSTLTLGGTNNTSTGFGITSGTISITNISALGNGDIIVGSSSGGNATVELNATAATVVNDIMIYGGGTLIDNGTSGNTNTYTGNIQLVDTPSNDNYAIEISDSNASLTLAGVISSDNAINLTFGGSGNIVLSGNNTFTGTTTINSKVYLKSANALSNTTVSVSNGTLGMTNPSLAVANNITFTGNSTLLSNPDSGSGNNSLSGTLTLSNNLNVIVANNHALSIGELAGSGNLTITSGVVNASTTSNSYTGTVTVNSGQINLASSNAVGTGDITINSNSGIGITGNNTTITNNIALASSANLVASSGNTNTLSGQITLAGTNTFNIDTGDTVNLTGQLTGGTATSLVKTGSGTVNISNAANDFTADVTINAGTLSIADTALALGSNDVTVSGGAFDIANALGAAFTNTIYLSGGSLTVGASNTLSGNIHITNASTISPETGAVVTLSGNMPTNSGALTVNGAGTLNLSGDNSNYSGSVTLANGTLQAGNASDPFGTGALTISGGTLQALVPVSIDNSSITINGNAIINTSNNMTLTSAVAMSSNLTLNGSATTEFASGISGAGNLTSSGGTTKVGGNNSGFSGNIALNAGALQVSNDNTNPLGTGAMTLNGGTLSATSDMTNALTNTITLTSNSTVGGSGDILFNGTTTTFNSGQILSVTNTKTTTFMGDVFGAGGVSQTAGTLVMSGTNSAYSGATSVDNATLRVTTSKGIGSSAVTVSNGATFDLSGVALNSNPVTLDNGTMYGGNSSTIGGAITLANGTTNNISVGTNGTFTINNNINGGGDIVYMRQDGSTGSMIMNGEVGDITPINSMTDNVGLIIGGTTTRANYDIVYNLPVTLVNEVTSHSLQGDVKIYSSFDGGHPFTIMADQGSAIIGGSIGATNAVSTVNISGAVAIEFTGGTIQSSGDQQYSGPIVLNGDTTLAFTGTDNTLTLHDSATKTFNITGTNSGTINGLGNHTLNFDSAKHINSGAGDNTFVIANGGVVTGTLQGSTTGNNTIDYSNYSDAVTVDIQTSNVNDGTFSTQSASDINFENIDMLIGNPEYNNTITVPSVPGKTFTVVYTGPNTGYIGDPIFFTNFTVIGGVLDTLAQQTPISINVNTNVITNPANNNVATILQQAVNDMLSDSDVFNRAFITEISDSIDSTITQNIDKSIEKSIENYDFECATSAVSAGACSTLKINITTDINPFLDINISNINVNNLNSPNTQSLSMNRN